jgi:L-threonylcarbamoyladenylate synthase
MTDCLAISKSAIARASGLLADGQLVAFPTETVYGLGADATNDMAVARIFAAKDRPAFNPLISHVASAAAAFNLGVETPIATVLASAFWPGPLTLVLDRRPGCPVARLTTAGLDKIAVRVPAHAAAHALLTHFGKPVAAPSANPSGRISPSTADHVMRGLAGKIDLVLDGGPCESGLESTVVDASSDQAMILRPGGITRNAVADALKAAGFDAPMADPTAVTQPAQPVAPGQLASHYAPHAAVRLNATKAAADEELIGFGSVVGSGTLALSLSASGDLIEAAANLFAMLHRADDTGTAKIAIAPVPDNGLGEAINDRLRRAAAPRR